MFRFRFPSFSRLNLSRPVAASSQLSDPRCFLELSSDSVLGSDYSASVSSVPFLPDFASQWLIRCTVSAFASTVFHIPSAWFPMLSSGFSYLASLFVSFRSSLFRSHSCSTGAYLRFRFDIFRFLSAHFRSLPFHFQLLGFLLLPFLLSTCMPCSGFLVSAVPLAFSSVSSSNPPGFPCFSSDYKYLAFR